MLHFVDIYYSIIFIQNKHCGIAVSQEWDLDAANKRLGSETIVCTVTATDRGGLETTTNVSAQLQQHTGAGLRPPPM